MEIENFIAVPIEVEPIWTGLNTPRIALPNTVTEINFGLRSAGNGRLARHGRPGQGSTYLRTAIIRYPARAVRLKPSAMECEARLRGRERIISSKTISPRLSRTKPACAERELQRRPSRLSPIGYRLSIIGYRLSAIDYRLSIIGYRLSAIDYRLSIIGYRLSAMQGEAPPAYRSKRNPSSRSTAGKRV